MEINSINISDISALSPLQPEGWVAIVPVFEFYINSPFCFPLKVMVDNEIAGVGVVIVHNDVAWLAHIIVHPDYRCRGIGFQIVQNLLKIANKIHCRTVYLIATELGEPVYKKAGFITETEYLVHKDVKKKDWVISDNIFLYEEIYKEHFRIFDRNISGEDRMAHLEEHLTNSFVYREENTVKGYYLPTLQEGLILADTETAGTELLKLHLKNNNSAVVPQENYAAQAFLKETGIEEVKAIKRMRLGKKRKVQFAHIYNRIGGNIG